MQIISGIAIAVFAFILEDLLKYFIFNPINDYRKLKGEIASALVYYANVYSNVIDPADKNKESRIAMHEEARVELRILASKLNSCGQLRYCCIPKKFIPGKSDLLTASGKLIGLSNSLYCGYNTHEYRLESNENRKTAEEIKSLLKI